MAGGFFAAGFFAAAFFWVDFFLTAGFFAGADGGGSAMCKVVFTFAIAVPIALAALVSRSSSFCI
ncbi:MAG: hypothetical protein ACR2NN_20030 [Bryobacteraceae bacterium]